MTDKERLEIVEELAKDFSDHEVTGEYQKADEKAVEVMQKHINWLIERAEHNQVLENSMKKAIEMQEYYLITNGDLQDENKRLSEALYAMDDFDIELGDSRDDMQNKLSQIKFIKDKALEVYE